MKRLLCVFLFLFFAISGYAQKTASQPPDSLRIYRKVETAAKKKKLTYWLYKEIFNLPDNTKKKEKQRKHVVYQNYQGRIIRTITVKTLDPFGYSVQDTSKHPKGVIEKGGNFLHQRTARFAISNRLLFNEGDTLDYLRLKESERILRQSPQVREIAIIVVPVKGSSDSVDVIVREQDYWSKDFGLSVDASRFNFSFSDKNLFGLSHYFSNHLYYDRQTTRYTVSGTYSIPYVGHTLIIPSLSYSSDKYNFSRGVSITRSFVSPLIKWAGSIDLNDVKTSGSAIFPDNDTVNYATRYFSKDFWLARSFSISNDTAEETRSTKLILGLRYIQQDFKYHAPEIITPLFYSEDRKFYLAGMGISNRTYYRDYYIYRFGVQEDVPAGRLLNFTAGYEWRPSGGRIYTGVESATGNHFDNLGYVTLRMSAGTFFKKGHTEQGVFKIGLGYFSDLLEMKKIKFRQFVKMNVEYGFNRVQGESLNLNDAIRGFKSDQLTGTKSATIALQTQAYLPFQLLGFRFAPFLFISAGLIGNDSETLTKSKLYQGYGLGLLVKNELLVIKSFQISIGIYPFIPGSDDAAIRYNPLRSTDFSFEDFEVGRPGIVGL